jgi:hypothetical protein
LYLFIFEKEYWHVDRKDSSFRVYWEWVLFESIVLQLWLFVLLIVYLFKVVIIN